MSPMVAHKIEPAGTPILTGAPNAGSGNASRAINEIPSFQQGRHLRLHASVAHEIRRTAHATVRRKLKPKYFF
jgi:hypothetical protein